MITNENKEIITHEVGDFDEFCYLSNIFLLHQWINQEEKEFFQTKKQKNVNIICVLYALTSNLAHITPINW